MYKVQITLTPEESQILDFKAQRLGYNVTKFIKLLIGKEVLSMVEQYPIISLSQKAINKIEKAHQEHKRGQTTRLNHLDDLDHL